MQPGHIHTNDPTPQTRGITIRWARYYDAIAKLMTLGREREIRKQTIELAGLKPGDRVLEVGCGTGSLALLAKDRVGVHGYAIGIDAAPEMVAVARRKATRSGKIVEFEVGLIEKMDFPDNSFDAVLSSLMMHHLPDDLKLQGLFEIRRVLKPGGRLLIVDIQRMEGSRQHMLMPILLHRSVPTGIQDLGALMQEAGFVQIETGDLKFKMLGFVRGLKGS